MLDGEARDLGVRRAEAPGSGQRPTVLIASICRRAECGGYVSGHLVVAGRAFVAASKLEVTRETMCVLVQPIGEDGLHRLSDAEVELAAAAVEDRCIGRVARELVLEHVLE